ncbi:MAG: hypothetical protein SH857_04190, partial [Chitinophagales bacterium]|nr:hypothetical protein [Chitinophagales bacterium]
TERRFVTTIYQNGVTERRFVTTIYQNRVTERRFIAPDFSTRRDLFAAPFIRKSYHVAKNFQRIMTSLLTYKYLLINNL